MKKLLAIAMLVALTGCASPVKTYLKTSTPLAEQGVIKWSDYYTGLHDQYAKSRDPDKVILMDYAGAMHIVAVEYETGKITRSAFQQAKMRADAQTAAIVQARSDQGLAALQSFGAAAMQIGADTTRRQSEMYQQRSIDARNQMPAPAVNTNCYTYRNQTNCTSQ